MVRNDTKRISRMYSCHRVSRGVRVGRVVWSDMKKKIYTWNEDLQRVIRGDMPQDIEALQHDKNMAEAQRGGKGGTPLLKEHLAMEQKRKEARHQKTNSEETYVSSGANETELDNKKQVGNFDYWENNNPIVWIIPLMLVIGIITLVASR